jgi:hypothetical protein
MKQLIVLLAAVGWAWPQSTGTGMAWHRGNHTQGVMASLPAAGTGLPALPQAWVNPQEYPVSSTTGWDVIKNIPGDYPATIAGLQQATDAWCAAPDQSWLVKVAAGTLISSNSTWTWCVKSGATKYFVARSSTPLLNGNTVCSTNHDTVDLAGGGNPRDPTCANDIGKMWTLEATGAADTIHATPGANHIVVEDMEWRPQTGMSTNIQTPIELGENTGNQSTAALAPHHIGIKRSFIHGWDTGTAQSSVTHTVYAQCSYCFFEDNYMDRIETTSGDAQCIATDNGPGPMRIVHNWCESAGEGFISGGATPNGGVWLQDLEFRRNRFSVDHAWFGQGGRNLKNRFELKVGRRVLVSGNILENSWKDGQTGELMLLNVRSCSAGVPCTGNEDATIEDVTVEYNIFRNALGAIKADARGGSENAGPGVSLAEQRVWVHDNLMYNIANHATEGSGGNDTAVFSLTTTARFPCTASRNAAGTQATLICQAGLYSSHVKLSGGFVRTGGVTTVTTTCGTESTSTACNPRYIAGQPVDVSNATDTSFNGTFTIAAATSTGFTYNQPGQPDATTSPIANGNREVESSSLGWSVTKVSTGDYLEVAGCSDSSFDTGTPTPPVQVISSNPDTLGPIVYANAGSANASATGCTMYYKMGWPRDTRIEHNTIVVNASGAKGLQFGSGKVFAMNFKLVNNIISAPAGYGIYCASNGEGTTAEACSDTSTATYDYNVIPGRTASSYTQWPGGAHPPTTMWFPANVACSGSSADSSCVGFAGLMGTSTYTTNLADYHGYALHPSSLYKAGAARQASDGKDLGADIAAIDAALSRIKYVCGSACGAGPY